MCLKEGFLAVEKKKKKHSSNKIIVTLIIGEIEPVSAFIVIAILNLINVSKIRTLVHNINSVNKSTSLSVWYDFRTE